MLIKYAIGKHNFFQNISKYARNNRHKQASSVYLINDLVGVNQNAVDDCPRALN